MCIRHTSEDKISIATTWQSGGSSYERRYVYMAYFRRFILMLQFLTAIPVKINVKAEREDFGKGLAVAPVVGLVIGALLSGGNYLLSLLF